MQRMMLVILALLPVLAAACRDSGGGATPAPTPSPIAAVTARPDKAAGSGPVDGAGLASGDIIVSMAGQRTGTTGGLFKALAEHRAGETVGVEYYHSARKEKAPVTLG